MSAIDVPDIVRRGDLVVVVSLSGGKDSTACALALREAGVPFRCVVADTGWEADESCGLAPEDTWKAHVERLRAVLGEVEVVRAVATEGAAGPTQGRIDAVGPFVAWAEYKAGFPMRRGRWCTEKLKLAPLKAAHERISRETNQDTINVIGIRAEESDERAAMPLWEDSDEWGGFAWRPIRDWTVEEVLAIHHRHGVPVNTLYHRGHNRVGCYPCIMADKEEIRLVAKHAPERVALIDLLERTFTEERRRRNASGEGNFEHTEAAFFQARDERSGTMKIREAVEWSRTSHGGRQFLMFEPQPRGGCIKWGLCEPPAKVTP